MRLQSGFVAALALIAATLPTRGQQKHAVVSADCVSVKYLKSGFSPAIVFSPRGDAVAYLVTSPNLITNQNETQLYISELNEQIIHPKRLVLIADDISQIHWLNSGNRIVALLRVGSRTTISEINTESGRISDLVRDKRGIDEYAIDSNASVVAYSVVDNSKTRNVTPDARDIAEGYPISVRRSTASGFHQHQVYLSRRRKSGSWSQPARVVVSSPFTGQRVSEFPAVSSIKLSLSPNGEHLLLTYLTDDPLPPDWERSPYVREMTVGIGFDISITVLQNLRTGKTSLPLESPEPWNVPQWSPDGGSYLAVASPPVSSALEEADYERNPTSYGPAHLFLVAVASGKIEEVTSEVANVSEQPLAWEPNGEILVHTGPNTIGRFSRVNGVWTKRASFTLPLPNRFQYGQLASDGSRIVGDYQATSIPPELFLYSPSNGNITILDHLNPQFEHLTLGPGKPVQWKTSTGFTINGLLLFPPDYVPGKRYPLVIQTKPEYGQFLCDAGEEYYPSFAPQPIVNAGMLYLIRSLPDANADRADADHFPSGYPGQIGEAAFHMDMWDKAVEMLNQEGLIDVKRIGIIGFSRAGWYTEFILTHSKTRYRAATVADNVQYSLGEYWMAHSDWILRGFETMYGGSPYGNALKNWMQYSISFNMDKVQTPLLMEEMGDGIRYTTEKAPPLKLALSFEVFTALKQLKQPVELYYYPNEPHQLTHPLARLASLQRNLAWYRHWLLGEKTAAESKYCLQQEDTTSSCQSDAGPTLRPEE